MNVDMDGSTGSETIDKPWDHAWSTEEMRKNRRDWSLAADSGLLKHLQQFSDNLTKKAHETQDAIDSMTSQLNETAILVDNLTNTSLALANTQFIESRVQEDNTEIEQPVEDTIKSENDNEFSATDLLVSVCESIREGLSIMDEKYEKVEVVASDSEDEEDNVLPSVILRPKDPYQDRPLPYVIGTEQWMSSNKVGLESSSSESEQNDEDEDSVSDTDDKNIGNMLSPNARTNLGIGRLSSTSSESNDYNVESSSIKDTDNSRLHARSQDTLNSDTEPTTPSSVLPKTQNINNGPPSFAEELAKRLGSVLPPQKNVVGHDSNEQVINCSKDDIFTPEDEQDVFSKKSDNLFSEGKNLFSDEVSSSSWKNKPVRPVNKNIIPPSIDVPPPLSIISKTSKSTIDDLFGDADDSEDSDDIFSKKSSKDIFASERDTIRSEVTGKQNIGSKTSSTPETNDKGKGLFEDEEDDDLFGSAAKQKTIDAPSESTKKKPVGGISIFGKVDIMSSSKFVRRPSSSSSSVVDSTDQHISSNNSDIAAVTSKSRDAGLGDCAALETGNNPVSNPTITGSSTGGSSGISIRQPSTDNTVDSSLEADFQPLMTSSRLKSEEIYRERLASDSLFSARSRTADSVDQPQEHQQQQQQPQLDDVFGPPPLPKASDGPRPKSKVASLFDDSDSGDDLFASASPGSRSLKSSERTPSKTQTQKKKSLFDDDDDLFGPKDAPDVDLFAAAPVKSLAKVTEGLFDQVDEPKAAAGLFATSKSPQKSNSLFSESDTKSAQSTKDAVQSLFDDSSKKVTGTSKVTDSLFGESSKSESNSAENKNSLFKEPTKIEKSQDKTSSKGLFDDSEESSDSNLFGKASKPAAIATSAKNPSSFSDTPKSLFGDTPDSDLFDSSSKSIFEKNIIEKSSDSFLSNIDEPTDLFAKPPNTESPKDLFEDKSKVSKPKKLTTSIFDDSDEDDLFGGSSLAKKAADNKTSSIVVDKSSTSVAKNMEREAKAENEQVKEEKKVKDASDSAKVSKSNEKSSIFDDVDDDDDLFGEKKKKTSSRENVQSTKSETTVKKETKESIETKTKTELPTKPEIPRKAILAEIKQKIENQLEKAADKSAAKAESNVVDGAVSSKKEPPKTLRIQTTLPMPDESSTNQQAPKKPAVSRKIQNLMGKVGDFKILSPTDTPPLLRKNNEEKNSNDDEEAAADLISSEASTPSLISGGSSPLHSGNNSRARDSPSLKSDNTEIAISFDEPAQVETLSSIAASKSRAKIPAKRRPQSRHARQSALRHSGIDFDIVDASATSPTSEQPNGDATGASLAVDRLLPTGKTHHTEASRHNPADSGHADDRSEISASRNTTTNLLSPSTDEEDLFDVPPDLPEDPAIKEDSLFGRAPILSPVETIEKPKKKVESAKKDEAKAKESRKRDEQKTNEKEEEKVEPLDPLRDSSHDPLKDPSQLFAFVTKTPSPEKNEGLLSNEDDDSLFSSSSKKVEEATKSKPKPVLDLFLDDDDTSASDLFSSSKTNLKRKPLKDTKIDLFDDVAADDDDNSLFGSSSKKTEKTKSKESSPTPSAAVKSNEKTDSKVTKTATKDIFDNSSDEDDIFAGSKRPISKKQTKSLFDDDEDNDDDDDDIFGKPKLSMMKDSKAAQDNDRSVVKKAVTRDLKKTAEKIVEDPLSMLQND